MHCIRCGSAHDCAVHDVAQHITVTLWTSLLHVHLHLTLVCTLPVYYGRLADASFDRSSRGITYTASAAAADSVLTPEPVKKVLELPGVESVYALGDWLCLNKLPSAKWDTIVSDRVSSTNYNYVIFG